MLSKKRCEGSLPYITPIWCIIQSIWNIAVDLFQGFWHSISRAMSGRAVPFRVIYGVKQIDAVKRISWWSSRPDYSFSVLGMLKNRENKQGEASKVASPFTVSN
jgi:hypothetical protein